MSYKWYFISSSIVLLCVVQGQPTPTGGMNPSSPICNLGAPLSDSNGTAVYCGRGSHRQDCPVSHVCVVHPGDYFAVCCTKGNGSCHEQYQLAFRSLVGSYIPACEEDGSYSALQCHGSTGECWCVMTNGTEIPGTRSYVGQQKPNCSQQTDTYPDKDSTTQTVQELENKPTFCGLPADKGPCDSNIPRWYFDVGSNQCGQFSYGGCDGNQNNFQDKVSCENMCHSKESTMCPYDQIWKSCGSVCDKTCADPDPVCIQMCTARCECPVDKPVLHNGVCIPADQCPGIGNDSSSMNTTTPAYCQLPPDQGPCEAAMTRWFYDPSKRDCATFTYGGCDGNKNKFQNKVSCVNMCVDKQCPGLQVWTDCGSPCTKTCYNRSSMCSSVCKPRCQCPLNTPVSHMGTCITESQCPVNDFPASTTTIKSTTLASCPISMPCRTICNDGYKRDQNGCQTCQCRDLCEGVNCTSSDFECMVQEHCTNGNVCKRVPTCLHSVCTEMYDPGPCRVRTDAWYFDSQTGKCDVFQYGGCLGNGNRFNTKQDCEAYCTPVYDISTCPVLAACSLNCKNGLKKDKLGCDICECEVDNSTCVEVSCSDPCIYGSVTYMDDNGCNVCTCIEPCQSFTCNENTSCQHLQPSCQGGECVPAVGCIHNTCLKPKDHGPCRARKPRYYYNNVTSQCELFYFGGCQGNENNFRTMESCRAKCMFPDMTIDPVTCPSITCSTICTTGLEKDSNGCDTCVCRQPPKPTCPMAICRMHCEHGFKTDDNGCDICTCQEAPKPTCSPITCTKTCPHGLKVDDNGCKICECKWNFCSNSSCDKTCEQSGYVIDNGCNQCRCNDPCENNNCTCETVPAVCTQNTTCQPQIKCFPDVCVEPKSTGPCRARKPRFFYNKGTDQCELFYFGGCLGNGNNFKTLVACKKTCMTSGLTTATQQVTTAKLFESMGTESAFEQTVPRTSTQRTVTKSVMEPFATAETTEEPMAKSTNSKGILASVTTETLINLTPSKTTVNPVITETKVYITPSKVTLVEPFTTKVDKLTTDTVVKSEKNSTTKPGTEETTTHTKTCESVSCNLKCHAGFEKDKTGCDICLCKQTPKPTCPMALCSMHCEHGFKTDDNGCDICSCQKVPKPTCSPVTTCTNTCPQGLQEDDNGCEICECKQNFCSNKTCDKNCTKSGYFMDLGCAQCTCNEPCEDHMCPVGELCIPNEVQCIRAPCPPVPTCVADVPPPNSCLQPKSAGSCRVMHSMWYYNSKAKECQTFMYSGCGGNDNKFYTKSTCINQCITFERPTCPSEQCPANCSLGYVKDKDGKGCVTSCRCKCADLQCTLPCMSGYKMDSDNCDICKCAPPPCPTCKTSDHCPFGHLKDQYGCNICGKCFDDPCKNYRMCNKGQVCVSNKVPCTDITCETSVKLAPVCVSDVPDICKQFTSTQCSVNTSLWYYSLSSQQCLQLTRKPRECPGTQNRFVSKLDCETSCKPSVVCPRTLVPLPYCKFGHIKDTSGCKTKQCIEDPCLTMVCPVNTVCQLDVQPDCMDNCTMQAVCTDAHNKSGYCPITSVAFNTLCGDSCNSDLNCPGQFKCCPTGCGKMCLPLQNSVETISSSCVREQQKSLLSLSTDPLNPTNVPMCDIKKHQYQPVQCNLHLGICWCQDPKTGAKIQKTQVRGIPDCTKTDTVQIQDEPVCPPGDQVHKCDPLLCSQHLCLGHPGAMCRLNPCGKNCSVEFYDKDGILLDYQSNCMKGISHCQKEQLSVYRTIWISIRMQILYSPKLSRDFTNHYMKLHKQVAEQSMKLYNRRQEDLTGPPRSNRQSSEQSSEGRGLPETESEHHTGPGGVSRGDQSRGEQGTSHLGNVDMPQMHHDHDPPAMAADMYVPQCRGLHQHFHGGYEFKQCAGQYCWCVSDSGAPVEGTLTYRHGLLNCGEMGRNLQLSSPTVSCSNNRSPSICCDSCNNQHCLGYTGKVHCVADPCSNCSVKFYTEHWNVITKCQAPKPKIACDGQCGWHYNKTSDMCTQSETCRTRQGLSSKQQCTLMCDNMLCTNMTNSLCEDICEASSCPLYPEAICQMDWCTCTPYFVDPITQTKVNCNIGVGSCHRYQSAYVNIHTLINTVQVPAVPQCDTKGHFISRQCVGGQCWCVDSVGNIVRSAPKNTCDIPAIVKVQIQLKFSNSFSQIANPTVMEQFKSVLAESLSDLLNIPRAFVQVVQVRKGSIIATAEVSEINNKTSVQVDTLKKAILGGSVNLTLNGQSLVFDHSQPVNVTYLYTQTVSTTVEYPDIEITTEGNDTISVTTDRGPISTKQGLLENDKIIIIIAAILLVGFFVLMIALIMCNRNNKKQKEEHFTDKEILFNNPVYGKQGRSGEVSAETCPTANGVSYA